ncbi:MAG: glycoside hydrolase family 71/99 protein [Planctomycetota bacterium]|jgi:hypothetical protein
MDERLKQRICLIVSVCVLVSLASATAASATTVGAYYYPWYGPGYHSTYASLRGHLAPQHHMALGDHDSSDPGIIGSHISYSVQANISFWVVSWWGPGGNEDNNFKAILAHPDADSLDYAIFYESPGRLGDMANPDYSNLIPDFQYMSDNYFDDPDYLKVNGHPVVFIYLTRVYFDGREGNALNQLRSAFPDVYIVGDDVFGGNYSASQAGKWEAVTSYDVYGQSLSGGSTQAGVNQLAGNYANARSIANSVGTGFIPCGSPGFNDKPIRDGHDGAPRYLEDVGASVEGDLFRAVLQDAVLPNLDSLGWNWLRLSRPPEQPAQPTRMIPVPATIIHSTTTIPITATCIWTSFARRPVEAAARILPAKLHSRAPPTMGTVCRLTPI